VIRTIAFDWRCETSKAQLGQTCFGQIKRFQTDAHIRTCDGFLASRFLCRCNGFCHDHSVEHATVVQNTANIRWIRFGIARVYNVFDDVLNRWEVCTDTREVRTDVALTSFTNRTQINVSSSPPVANELVHRVTDFRSFGIGSLP